MTRSFFARGRRAESKPGRRAPEDSNAARPDTASSTDVAGSSIDQFLGPASDPLVGPGALLHVEHAAPGRGDLWTGSAADQADRTTVIGLGDAPSLGALTTGERALRRATHRRISTTVRRVHGWIRDADTDVVALHTGSPPTDERIAELRAALDRPVDRGGGSQGRGRNVRRALEIPDIVVEDDGTNATLTRAWQTLARGGAHAVTTGAPREGDSSVVLVRRSVADRGKRPPRDANRLHASWWMSVAFVVMFTCWEAFRLVTERSDIPRTTQEVAWISAARAGSVDGIGDAPLPGSSMWPAIAQPVVDFTDVTGLRWFALLCAIGSIVLASVAASRLFGRWAGRTTSVLLAIAFSFLDVATSVGPVPLSMLALSTALLGVALVEHHDRKSWILLAGLASTVAAVVAYQSIVFVGLLSFVFTVVRGRRGLNDSTTFRLVLLGGALAWFLPTREATLAFASTPRWRVDWIDLATDTIMILAAVGAAAATAHWGSTRATARRRMTALGLALLGVPLAQVISGNTLADGSDLGLALVIAIPGLGGAIAARFAAWRFGEEVVPEPRAEPQALVVDPSTGELRGRLVRYANRQVRLAVALVVLTALWYLPWAFANVDWRNWWLAVPFLFANLCMVGTALLSGFNNWNRAIPVPLDVAAGHEPLVGVIVPTYSEPMHMVMNTVRSVFDQDWPANRLRVVVSDDAHDDQMRDAVYAFARRLPPGALRYNRPPKKGDPARRGESKSGNLNSAVLLLADCDYVETRDADDLVGSSNFLRSVVGQLMHDRSLGFAQTIKETTTSEGDPFNNNEPFFYRGTMLARNSDLAVFPCGSGLVWRNSALETIDHFPGWNLVEDLHSGVLGLREGWGGLYVPIVGAYAQHSPEDVANVFKQRGTWALDTTRLLLFDRFKDIPWKRRLHFMEQAIFYLLSFPLMILVLVPGLGLFLNRFPLVTDATTYAIRFWGFALAVELMLLSLAAAQPAGSLWRSRLSWIGMAPVYAKAAVRALWYGPKKKPAYKVTRKTDDYQWYVKLVKSHWFMLIATGVAIVIALLRDDFLTELDLGSVYWAIVAMIGLGSFLRLSWFGVDPRERLRLRWERTVERWHRVRTMLGFPPKVVDEDDEQTDDDERDEIDELDETIPLLRPELELLGMRPPDQEPVIELRPTSTGHLGEPPPNEPTRAPFPTDKRRR